MWKITVAIAMLACGAGAQTADPYAPLRVVDGKWSVMSPGKAKPDTLENHCALTGQFYVCEQTVNGAMVALVTFLPSGAAGHYFTSPLGADAQPIGRGELTIDGRRWTYFGSNTADGKTTYYRTINMVSADGNSIAFDVQSSKDRVSWDTSLSGLETRVK